MVRSPRERFEQTRLAFERLRIVHAYGLLLELSTVAANLSLLVVEHARSDDSWPFKPGSTDQPLLLSRESAVAADGLVGCRSTGVGA